MSLLVLILTSPFCCLSYPLRFPDPSQREWFLSLRRVNARVLKQTDVLVRVPSQTDRENHRPSP